MQELRNDEVLYKVLAYEVVESHDLGKFVCNKLRHKYDDWGPIPVVDYLVPLVEVARRSSGSALQYFSLSQFKRCTVTKVPASALLILLACLCRQNIGFRTFLGIRP